MSREYHLNAAEVRLIVEGLQARSNFIQTGTVTLSACDMAEGAKAEGAAIRPLAPNQMRLVADMDDLINKLRS